MVSVAPGLPMTSIGEAGAVRTVQWQGISKQLDWQVSASARSQPARHLDGLVAFGEQSCADFEFTWQLSTSSSWATERLDMRLVGLAPGSGQFSAPKLNRTLLLEQSAAGWRSTAWRYDDATALPAPGLAGNDHPAPTLDVVIDACPLSHWAPIRRLGLAGPRQKARRGSPSRPLATAFPVLRVRLPSLSVSITRHRYVWVEDLGQTRLLKHSFAGEPTTALTVDDQGVPIEFDGLYRRADSALVA